jgi:hypothetical protein
MDPRDASRTELASQGAEWARLSSEWYRRATAWSMIATRWGSSSDPRLRALSARADAMSRQAHRLVTHLRMGALELLDLATR